MVGGGPADAKPIICPIILNYSLKGISWESCDRLVHAVCVCNGEEITELDPYSKGELNFTKCIMHMDLIV